MDESRRCTATNRQGERCKLPAIIGGTVCRSHGGRAPQVRAAAARRREEQKAAGLLAAYEATPITDPLEQLAGLAGEIVRWQRVIQDQVADLHDFTSTDWMEIEHARAVVELYERALDRTGRVLVAIAKLDLEGRMTAVAEAQLEMLVRAVDRAADRTLPVHLRQPLRLAIAQELRAA